MRMLALHQGQADPSTRYRVHPWLRRLAAEGIHCDERPGTAWRYPEVKSGAARHLRTLPAVGRSLADAIATRRYDVVFAQRFLFPHRAASLDRLLRLAPWLVVDVQDALFCAPGDDRPVHAARLRRLCAAADRVLVSNAFMAEWVGMPAKTAVMPSVVDADVVPARDPQTVKETVTLGWLGVANQFDYVRPLLPVLRELARRAPIELLLHTSTIDPREVCEAGLSVRILPFDPTREIDVLHAIDIGLMPMPQTLYNLGKCPVKMVQYMAAGCAVVCSPVGSNLEMIDDGVHGYFAAAPDEWYERLWRLVDDAATRAAMGRAGRKRFEERYSVQANWPRFLAAVTGATQGRG